MHRVLRVKVPADASGPPTESNASLQKNPFVFSSAGSNDLRVRSVSGNERFLQFPRLFPVSFLEVFVSTGNSSLFSRGVGFNVLRLCFRESSPAPHSWGNGVAAVPAVSFCSDTHCKHANFDGRFEAARRRHNSSAAPCLRRNNTVCQD